MLCSALDKKLSYVYWSMTVDSMTSQRILREIREMERDQAGISEFYKAEPVDNNLLLWTATLFGPPQTNLEGKNVNVEIIIPQTYPFKPPKVRLLTQVSSQFVLADGSICLDILNTAWSPALTIDRVLLSLLSVLTDSPIFRERLRRRAD